ncbi:MULTISPECIES: hypothetical protein [Streptomyces]|uniref:DUF397 domain-containing protein n=1 Tax=Streptomyces katsurahamanus TaxID=2577098 RepID=A0ABW9NU58_9ACTN|nr:hypothetical protein [Streptomyces katsurahamanus]MQS36686.1 hypothetical protein [Streptomyces katsurahamanus]
MKLTWIAGGDPDCRANDCPTVYVTDQPRTLAVQGYLVEHPTPEGEAVVSIPEDVLREAMRALGP